MTDCSLPYVIDSEGRYRFKRKVTSEDIVHIATSILEAQFACGDIVNNPNETKRYLTFQIGQLEHECFCCLFLNTRHRILRFEQIFTGTIDGCSVYPREVVKRALQCNAAAVIFAHNHPSGVGEPSRADELLTKRLKEALALLDIRVLDHIVVAGTEAISFAERGLL